MIEILPIRLLTEEDALFFGKLNVALGKLARSGFSVTPGVVITPPDLHLKTALEHFDFGSKEMFEQSLTLVKKEINTTPVPEILIKETKKQKQFLLNGKVIKSVKNLWQDLLTDWLDEIKQRLWQSGFYPGITEGLEPRVVAFIKKVEAYGSVYFDFMQDDSVISVKYGKLHPNDLKKLDEIVKSANKKLFIPHEYEWIVDREVKLIGLKPLSYPEVSIYHTRGVCKKEDEKEIKSAVKVFLDMSGGQAIGDNIDGIYIASEKIFDLNKPRDSLENLIFKIVESASAFPDLPVLVKLADKSEGMGKVRGTLRLMHQKSLFDPLTDAVDFARHKKGLINVHIVVPFVRSVNELLQIKRELAIKKLMRKNSLQIWMEVATPENILNLEDYILQGIDGVVLNLDELIAHLGGFDHKIEELNFYKEEVTGLLKFLEDGIRILHKSKVPFIAGGSIVLEKEVLEFLVQKGVYGIVVEKYDSSSIRDLLYQVETKHILSLGTS